MGAFDSMSASLPPRAQSSKSARNCSASRSAFAEAGH